MAVTKRELHQRIASARGELAAMIFFAMPTRKERQNKRPSRDRRERDDKIKGLAHVLNLLFDGEIEGPEGHCGACVKLIRGGQKIVHTEDAGNFHATAKCWGKSIPAAHTHRAETQREQDRDARARLRDAQAYLRERGIIV